MAARAGLDAVKASRPPRDTVATLTGYDDALAAIIDLDAQSELARQGSPDPAMRKAAEECDRQIQAMLTTINQDRALYDALSALDLSGQNVSTRWWMTRDLREFRRAGVDRDGATREKVRALNDELVAIGQEFDRNIPADVRKVSFAPADLAGLPADFLAAHPPGPDGKIVLTTDYPDYFPVRSYARKAKTREALWRAFMNRAAPEHRGARADAGEAARAGPDARLCELGGLRDGEQDDPHRQGRLGLHRAHHRGVGRSRRPREEAAAGAERKDIPGAKALDPWDVVYYGERVKAERYRFDAQSARPYFEAGRVFQGVLDVSGKLFDIAYRPVEQAVVWHAEVRTFDVIAGPSFGDRAGKSLGRIYLDLHPRDGKFKHAAQFTVISGQAGHRLPEGALLCNSRSPAG
jgi:thimet oligopeptidase